MVYLTIPEMFALQVVRVVWDNSSYASELPCLTIVPATIFPLLIIGALISDPTTILPHHISKVAIEFLSIIDLKIIHWYQSFILDYEYDVLPLLSNEKKCKNSITRRIKTLIHPTKVCNVFIGLKYPLFFVS